jgi:arylamine N-acetyltransferase
MFFTTASKHQPHDEASAMASQSQMPNSNLQSPKKGCPVTEKAEEAVLPKDDIAIATKKNSDTEQQAKGMTDEEMARKLQEEFGSQIQHETAASETVFDKDEEFAMQLQSKFDKEHEVLSHVERFSAAKRKGTTATRKEGKKKGKRGKIDFFLGK